MKYLLHLRTSYDILKRYIWKQFCKVYTKTIILLHFGE